MTETEAHRLLDRRAVLLHRWFAAVTRDADSDEVMRLKAELDAMPSAEEIFEALEGRSH